VIFFFSVQAPHEITSGCPSESSVPLQSANQSPAGVTSPAPAAEILWQHGLQDSFWGLRIIAWEVSGERPQEVIGESWSWTTCACGKQDSRLQRNPNGAPSDQILFDLGMEFGAIWDCDPQDPPERFNADPVGAAQCLIAIEKRSAQILKGVTQ
jgi:hypothetical protein